MNSSTRLTRKDHGVHLPHDLIEHILAKLPAKSLVRFKCVSEQWFRLIADPCFIAQHLSNQRKKGPGFVSASFRFVHHYDILNSCDGILCFPGRYKIWLHNPSTKEYRLLPTGPGVDIADLWCKCQPRGFGIGRDLVSKRYKIVRLSNPCPGETGKDGCHHCFCAVFTLDPNPNACWKTIGQVPYRINPSSRSVYANGAIYWFTDETYHLNKTEVIVMFDLHNEKFEPIPHPSSCSNKQRWTMQLGTLRECLCLARQEPDVLNIWIMEKQQQQQITWEKLYCIELMGNDPLQIGPRFAFAEHKDGTLLVCTENNETRLPHRYGQCVPTAFTESLVHVYGGTVTQLKWLPASFAESVVLS